MDGKAKLPNTSQPILSFHKQFCAASPPLWSLLDAAVFHYSQQTLGLHIWPHHPEHTAHVQLAAKFPLLNRLISSFYHNKNPSSQTSWSSNIIWLQLKHFQVPIEMFSFCSSEQTWPFSGRKHSYPFFTSDTLLSSLMVLFLTLTRNEKLSQNFQSLKITQKYFHRTNTQIFTVAFTIKTIESGLHPHFFCRLLLSFYLYLAICNTFNDAI